MITVRHLLDRKDRALFTIEPGQPVLDAIRMMAEHHVGALLVMRGTELVGIV
jgi:CBS domain-containing protein